MTKDEALKLALEALEVANSCVDGYYIPKGKTHLPEIELAITAIKEALAQPEPEYLAFMDAPQRTWVGLTDEERNWIYISSKTEKEIMQMVEANLRSKNT